MGTDTSRMENMRTPASKRCLFRAFRQKKGPHAKNGPDEKLQCTLTSTHETSTKNFGEPDLPLKNDTIDHGSPPGNRVCLEGASNKMCRSNDVRSALDDLMNEAHDRDAGFPTVDPHSKQGVNPLASSSVRKTSQVTSPNFHSGLLPVLRPGEPGTVQEEGSGARKATSVTSNCLDSLSAGGNSSAKPRSALLEAYVLQNAKIDKKEALPNIRNSCETSAMNKMINSDLTFPSACNDNGALAASGESNGTSIKPLRCRNPNVSILSKGNNSHSVAPCNDIGMLEGNGITQNMNGLLSSATKTERKNKVSKGSGETENETLPFKVNYHFPNKSFEASSAQTTSLTTQSIVCLDGTRSCVVNDDDLTQQEQQQQQEQHQQQQQQRQPLARCDKSSQGLINNLSSSPNNRRLSCVKLIDLSSVQALKVRARAAVADSEGCVPSLHGPHSPKHSYSSSHCSRASRNSSGHSAYYMEDNASEEYPDRSTGKKSRSTRRHHKESRHKGEKSGMDGQAPVGNVENSAVLVSSFAKQNSESFLPSPPPNSLRRETASPRRMHQANQLEGINEYNSLLSQESSVFCGMRRNSCTYGKISDSTESPTQKLSEKTDREMKNDKSCEEEEKKKKEKRNHDTTDETDGNHSVSGVLSLISDTSNIVDTDLSVNICDNSSSCFSSTQMKHILQQSGQSGSYSSSSTKNHRSSLHQHSEHILTVDGHVEKGLETVPSIHFVSVPSEGIFVASTDPLAMQKDPLTLPGLQSSTFGEKISRQRFKNAMHYTGNRKSVEDMMKSNAHTDKSLETMWRASQRAELAGFARSDVAKNMRQKHPRRHLQSVGNDQHSYITDQIVDVAQEPREVFQALGSHAETLDELMEQLAKQKKKDEEVGK